MKHLALALALVLYICEIVGTARSDMLDAVPAAAYIVKSEVAV